MASAAGGTASDRILRRLVDADAALSVRRDCRRHEHAGVDGDTEVFRWRAIAGRWAHFTGGTIERDRSAAGRASSGTRPC